MGGVPYRSKGCNTCRRRRIKCDEQKPQCERCIKSGYVCDGYERNLVFVQNSHSDKGPVWRPRNASNKIKDPKALAASTDKTESSILRFDVNPGVRTQFVANFIDSFSPAPIDRDGKVGVIMHLQDAFPEFIGRSPVLDKAITALSSAFLAKRNQDQQLLQYSTKLYGEALRTVHGRIRSGRKCGQDSLFTTVIFQIYELINSSPLGFPAWLAHVQGSNAILANYDSPRPTSATEHLFCRQLKLVTICDAMSIRKSAYSYSQFWQNQPSDSPWQEPIDDLLDLLLECSALVEQVDQLLAHGHPTRPETLKTGEYLLDSCLSLRGRVDYGFCAMQQKLGIPSCPSNQSPFWSEIDHSMPRNLFEDSIEFPSVKCAETHLLYWTLFMVLYPLLGNLLTFFGWSREKVPLTLWDVPTSQSEMSLYATWAPGLPENSVDVAEYYADLICRSARFMVQPRAKAMGVQILLGPFSQATKIFHDQRVTVKARWCQSVFMALPKLGFGVAPFLKDYIWALYAKFEQEASSTPETASSEDLSIST